jgi:hypothetical protein
MAAPPPESLEPEEDDTKGDKRFGWYVVCNGRVVLAADKTSASVWGIGNWQQWHRQYSGFIGIVLFSSPNAAALPLTTTKRNVDVSSEVFLRARAKMYEITEAWIDYTNSRKPVISTARELEQAAVPVSIYALPKRAAVALPKFEKVPVQKRGNVNYAMPEDRLRALGNALGDINMTFRNVGIKSFEYAFKDLVGEE